MRGAVLLGQFGLHEHADEIVLRLLAACSDDGRDDVEHLLRIANRRPHVKRLLRGDPEAAGDREHRDRRAEVDIQFGTPRGGERIDQRVDRVLDPIAHPPLGFRRYERRLDQRPVAPMPGAAHRQHAVLHVGRSVEVGARRIRRRGEKLGIAVRRVAGLVGECGEVRAVRIRKPVEHEGFADAGQLVNGAGMNRRLFAQLRPDLVGVAVVRTSESCDEAAAQIEQLAHPLHVEQVLGHLRLRSGHAHRATYPPSTGRSTPVTLDALSETR